MKMVISPPGETPLRGVKQWRRRGGGRCARRYPATPKHLPARDLKYTVHRCIEIFYLYNKSINLNPTDMKVHRALLLQVAE